MKKLFLTLLLCAMSHAQTVNKQTIIDSRQYYYGTGVSIDQNEAKNLALTDMNDQIAVNVASTFEHKLQEHGDRLVESVKSVIKTHSASTIRNVKFSYRQLRDGKIETFCYLHKSEVRKIYDERKKLIADIYGEAGKHLKNQNAAYGLKLYYFAAILLNSLPDQNVEYNGKNYTTLIPKMINGILDQVRFTYVKDRTISDKEREVTLKVDYRGKPAAMLDFSFWEGDKYVLVQGKDGLATFRLLGASVGFAELKVVIKYKYYECREEYNIIATLWDVVNKPDYNRLITVPLAMVDEAAAKEVIQQSGKINKRADLSLSQDVSSVIEDEANKFYALLKSGDISKAHSAYGSDPFLYEKVNRYMRHNQPNTLDDKIHGDLEKTCSGWELRKVRVLHNYPTISKQANEYLVLDFNEEGRLVDVNVSITNALYSRNLEKLASGDDWQKRHEIIKFLEKYRTAYLTRDLETINLIFAEEALIIIGRKIEKKKLPEGMVRYQPFGNQPDHDYIKLTKNEYLKRQNRIFQVQQDIALDFSTLEINRKDVGPDIYGVEMRQSYASTTYADEGYLFLLVDFDEPDPMIYVRAWQPNEWSEDDKIKAGNYKIHK